LVAVIAGEREYCKRVESDGEQIEENGGMESKGNIYQYLGF
jgi:hypothetical protein